MLVSILVLVVPVVVIMLAIHIFRDDSEGKYKYCTVEKAWAEYRAGGDTGGNKDLRHAGKFMDMHLHLCPLISKGDSIAWNAGTDTAKYLLDPNKKIENLPQEMAKSAFKYGTKSGMKAAGREVMPAMEREAVLATTAFNFNL